MKSLFAITCMCWIAIQAQAQTLPYSTGFDTPAEQAGWDAYRTGTTTDTFYLWEYSTNTPFSPPTRLSHNYPVGGVNVTDDWFVSPAFDFGNGGRIDSVRYKFTGFGIPAPEDTVAIYMLVGNQDPSQATSRKLLVDFRDTLYTADDQWRLLTDVEISPTASPVHIAFRYRTVVNWLDARFDNLGLSRNDPGTGIGALESSTPQIAVYPNPANELVTVHSAEPWKLIRVLDLSGRSHIVKRRYQENLYLPVAGLAAGTYILQVEQEDGTMQSRKLHIR